MHERIRVLEPDLVNLELAILQFDGSSERKLRIYLDRDCELFDFDQLERMTIETYEIWDEILEGREFEARRSGRTGPLGI
jgi:hypothetical protein